MLNTLNPFTAIRSHFDKKKYATASKLLKDLRDMEQESATLRSMVYSNVGSVAYDEVIDRCVKNFVQRWTRHVNTNRKLSRIPSDTLTPTMIFNFGTHLLDYLGKGMIYLDGHYSEIDRESDQLMRRFYSLYEHKLPPTTDFDFKNGLGAILNNVNQKLSIGTPHLTFQLVEHKSFIQLSGKMLRVVDIYRSLETDVIVDYQGRTYLLNIKNCVGGKLHWYNTKEEKVEITEQGD